jgi:hypothetical protein
MTIDRLTKVIFNMIVLCLSVIAFRGTGMVQVAIAQTDTLQKVVIGNLDGVKYGHITTLHGDRNKYDFLNVDSINNYLKNTYI